jgi:hypothetical protein
MTYGLRRFASKDLGMMSGCRNVALEASTTYGNGFSAALA